MKIVSTGRIVLVVQINSSLSLCGTLLASISPRDYNYYIFPELLNKQFTSQMKICITKTYAALYFLSLSHQLINFLDCALRCSTLLLLFHWIDTHYLYLFVTVKIVRLRFDVFKQVMKNPILQAFFSQMNKMNLIL